MSRHHYVVKIVGYFGYFISLQLRFNAILPGPFSLHTHPRGHEVKKCSSHNALQEY